MTTNRTSLFAAAAFLVAFTYSPMSSADEQGTMGAFLSGHSSDPPPPVAAPPAPAPTPTTIIVQPAPPAADPPPPVEEDRPRRPRRTRPDRPVKSGGEPFPVDLSLTCLAAGLAMPGKPEEVNGRTLTPAELAALEETTEESAEPPLWSGDPMDLPSGICVQEEARVNQFAAKPVTLRPVIIGTANGVAQAVLNDLERQTGKKWTTRDVQDLLDCNRAYVASGKRSKRVKFAYAANKTPIFGRGRKFKIPEMGTVGAGAAAVWCKPDNEILWPKDLRNLTRGKTVVNQYSYLGAPADILRFVLQNLHDLGIDVGELAVRQQSWRIGAMGGWIPGTSYGYVGPRLNLTVPLGSGNWVFDPAIALLAGLEGTRLGIGFHGEFLWGLQWDHFGFLFGPSGTFVQSLGGYTAFGSISPVTVKLTLPFNDWVRLFAEGGVGMKFLPQLDHGRWLYTPSFAGEVVGGIEITFTKKMVRTSQPFDLKAMLQKLGGSQPLPK